MVKPPPRGHLLLAGLATIAFAIVTGLDQGVTWRLLLGCLVIFFGALGTLWFAALFDKKPPSREGE